MTEQLDRIEAMLIELRRSQRKVEPMVATLLAGMAKITGMNTEAADLLLDSAIKDIGSVIKEMEEEGKQGEGDA